MSLISDTSTQIVIKFDAKCSRKLKRKYKNLEFLLKLLGWLSLLLQFRYKLKRLLKRIANDIFYFFLILPLNWVDVWTTSSRKAAISANRGSTCNFESDKYAGSNFCMSLWRGWFFSVGMYRITYIFRDSAWKLKPCACGSPTLENVCEVSFPQGKGENVDGGAVGTGLCFVWLWFTSVYFCHVFAWCQTLKIKPQRKKL